MPEEVLGCGVPFVEAFSQERIMWGSKLPPAGCSRRTAVRLSLLTRRAAS